jgi:hypothetical protein
MIGNLPAGWIERAWVWLNDGPISVPGALVWFAYVVFVIRLFWLLSRKPKEGPSAVEIDDHESPTTVNVDMVRLEQDLLSHS